MKIKREALLHSLEAVSPGLSTKEIIEQSSSIVFKNGCAITFNDEVSCSIKTPLEIEGAVVAAPLLSFLQKLNTEEIDIDLVDKELLVNSGRDKAGIKMQGEVTLPIDGIETPEEWKKLPKEFVDAINIVQQCCSTDESSFVITCVHIHKNHVEATDSYQICRYPLKTGVDRDMLIRRTSLKSIVGTDMTEFSETENWIHFKNPAGLVVSCRRYKDKYPELDKWLDVSGDKMVLPKELEEAISKAEIFSSVGDDINQVQIELRSGKMKLTGRGAHGWYSKVLDTGYDGENLSFLISPKLLLEITKRTDECEVTDGRMKIDGRGFSWVTCTSKT